MITRIGHLDIAVRSIDAALPYYEKALGLRCGHREEVASQQARTAFFELGEVHLELLEPTSPESPAAKFIETNGEGIHHIAFATTKISGQLGQAADAGVRLIHEKPLEGAGKGMITGVIEPAETRSIVALGLRNTLSKRESRPPRKHGNIRFDRERGAPAHGSSAKNKRPFYPEIRHE